MTLSVGYSNFRKDLKSYMRQVNADADTIIVTNSDPADNVIVMSVADYDSLMETVRVYSNPYLREKVAQGIEQVQRGEVTHHALFDDEGVAE